MAKKFSLLSLYSILSGNRGHKKRNKKFYGVGTEQIKRRKKI